MFFATNVEKQSSGLVVKPPFMAAMNKSDRDRATRANQPGAVCDAGDAHSRQCSINARILG